MNDSVIGTEVEGYRIQEVLGRGGMGVVYKAKDVALSRSVALKRIDPSLANDEAFLRRFRSEARALARIDSPYIVGVHALRQTEIGLLIVMEYVDGGTLKDVIQEGPMDWQEALPVIKQMLTALEHAHSAEVIHRDIKPRNVMLSTEGTVKVTDFGLAKVHRDTSQETVTQGVHGTLNYMSPEQVQGGANLDHRSDLYSLGMTVYEMLAGDLPFDRDSSEFTKMRMIVEEELPQPTALRPSVPDQVSALVMKALEKDPDDRFQSAEVMRDAFEAVESRRGGEEGSAGARTGAAEVASVRRWGRLGVVLAMAVVVFGLGAYWMFGSGGESDGGNAVEERPASSGQTRITVSTEPIGADVYRNGTLLGVTPVTTAVDTGSVSFHFEKQGYAGTDTTLTVTGATASLTVPLRDASIAEAVAGAGESESETDPSTPSDNGTDSGEQETSDSPSEPPPTPEPGTLALTVRPTGTVYVDGEAQSSGESIQLPAGTHDIRFEHPTYDRVIDTTLTVRAGDTEELTCYFEHDVAVRASPVWASVYLNGENTDRDTPVSTQLGPGTHKIAAHVADQRGWRITGGEYRRSVGGERRSGTFSGPAKTITLAPACEQQTHVIAFQLTENAS